MATTLGRDPLSLPYSLAARESAARVRYWIGEGCEAFGQFLGDYAAGQVGSFVSPVMATVAERLVGSE